MQLVESNYSSCASSQLVMSTVPREPQWKSGMENELEEGTPNSKKTFALHKISTEMINKGYLTCRWIRTISEACVWGNYLAAFKTPEYF